MNKNMNSSGFKKILLFSIGFLICTQSLFSQPLQFVESYIDGENGMEGLERVSSAEMSPDGNYLYVIAAGGSKNNLTVLSRNENTGKLTFVESIEDQLQFGMPNDLAISPDGAHVYVVGVSNSILLFSRNASTGKLTYVSKLTDGSDGVDGLSYPTSVSISPDGKHVYAASFDDNAVSVFSRNASTGALTYVEMQQNGVNGVSGLTNAYYVKVSPDGGHVYALSHNSGTIAVFSRNASTGTLTFVTVYEQNVNGIDYLSLTERIDFTSDGSFAYVTAECNVITYSRNASTGELTYIEKQNYSNPFYRVFGINVSPDDEYVYVARTIVDGIIMYKRDMTTGMLTTLVIRENNQDGITGMTEPRTITVHPDGNDVYVGARGDDSIVFFENIPPRFTGSSPVGMTHAAALSTDVTLTFDKDITSSTVTDETYTVQSGFQGQVQGSLSVTGGSITLNPDSDFFPGEKVQVTATREIWDTDEYLRAEPYVLEFRTAVNGGYGSFGEQAYDQFGTGATKAVALGDVDGDGDLDAVVANYNAPQEVWLNQSGDQSGDAANFGTTAFDTFGGGYSNDLVLGDVDGDGDLDAVVANHNGLEEVWINQGGDQGGTAGNFGSSAFDTFGSSSGTTTSIALGDLDADGDLDAIIGEYGNANSVWFNQSGDQGGPAGDFGTAAVQTFDSGGTFDIALGDMDSDGDLDVITANDTPDENEIRLNQGNSQYGTLGEFGTTAFDTFDSHATYSIDLGDVNGDGHLDVICANWGWATHQVWGNSGNGTMSIITDFGSEDGADEPGEVALGDLDGDGDLDAAIAYRSATVDAQQVWLNQGGDQNGTAGEFGTEFYCSFGSGTSNGLALGDLDGDGKLDALIANDNNEEQEVWINTGTVRVQARIFLEGPYDAEFTDFSPQGGMVPNLDGKGALPMTSPYSEDPVTATESSEEIVDWVLVEIRSKADSSSLDAKSGLLHASGRILNPDGSREYLVFSCPPGNYFIVVRHRNHLAVMSAAAQALSSDSSTLYNFITGTDKYYGGEANLLKEDVAEGNVYGMYTGDINQDGEITTADYTKWYNDARIGASGYKTCDLNLDTEVTTEDYTKWYNNAREGASSQVPD